MANGLWLWLRFALVSALPPKWIGLLLMFLAANGGQRFCLACTRASIEARSTADMRAIVRVALASNAGIRVERAPCDHCRTVGAVISLKT